MNLTDLIETSDRLNDEYRSVSKEDGLGILTALLQELEVNSDELERALEESADELGNAALRNNEEAQDALNALIEDLDDEEE